MCYYVLLDNVQEDWIENNDTINACESKVLVNILLETYILSRCGVVRFFYTQTKSKAARLALKVVKDLLHLEEYGIDNDLNKSLRMSKVVLEKMCLHCIHCKDSTFCSLNMVQQHLFAKSWSDLRGWPPIETK